MATAGAHLLEYSSLTGTATAKAHFLAVEFGGTPGPPGDVIHLLKEVEMKVSANQEKINMEVQEAPRTIFTIENKVKEVKFKVTWQRN